MIHKLKSELWLDGRQVGLWTECNQHIPRTDSGNVATDEDDKVTCYSCLNVLIMMSKKPEQLEGVWVVYAQDLQITPLYVDPDELEARRYQEQVGYYTYLKFWRFCTEWGAEP